MSAFKELTITEMEIMEFLWEQEEPTSFTTVMDYFNNQRDKEWKRTSLSTHLMKLAEKGLITPKNRGRQMFYTIVMSVEEYESKKANNILDDLYDGSIRKFMTALHSGKKVSKTHLNDLKQWLDDME